MSNSAEYGQDHGVLTRAAGMVADARTDFMGYSNRLSGQIAGVQGKWGGAGASAFFTLHQAWSEKQKVIVDALNEFESSLVTTERDNVDVDEQQGAGYKNIAGKLDA
jgi:WXG100 family type VII secretion target